MQSEQEFQEEQKQQLLIQDLVTSFLPWDNLIDSHTTLIANSTHQYECIITSAVWNKVRLYKVCKVTLTEQDPLFWVLKNSGREYLKMYVKSKKNGYNLFFPSPLQIDSSNNNNNNNNNTTTQSPLSFFLISLNHESNHLTQKGVNEQTYKLKHQNHNENNCFCKTISQDFSSQYWNESRNEQASLKSLNERFPFCLYKMYLQSWHHQPEGFTSSRQIKEFKGKLFERVTFQICYQNYKEVAYEETSNSQSETVYQIPVIVNQKEYLCFMTESIIELDNKQTNEGSNNSNNSNIQKPKFILLPQREDNMNVLEMLEQGQFDKIFTDHNSFIYNWMNVFEYPIDGEYLQFCQEEGLKLPFAIGSVLLAPRQVESLQEGYQQECQYFDAAVFIKYNEVISVNNNPNNSKEYGVFKKDSLRNFLGNSKNVKEYRFKMCFYTADELNCKAESVDSSVMFNNNNCEQLVFQLACNINFSDEIINNLKRLIPKAGKMIQE